MSIQDRINALFEGAGVTAALFNCHALIRDDGAVMGISILSVVFFSVWGAWNLYYYAHLKQPASQFAAGGLLLANTAWLLILIYYRVLA